MSTVSGLPSGSDMATGSVEQSGSGIHTGSGRVTGSDANTGSGIHGGGEIHTGSDGVTGSGIHARSDLHRESGIPLTGSDVHTLSGLYKSGCSYNQRIKLCVADGVRSMYHEYALRMAEKLDSLRLQWVHMQNIMQQSQRVRVMRHAVHREMFVVEEEDESFTDEESSEDITDQGEAVESVVVRTDVISEEPQTSKTFTC